MSSTPNSVRSRASSTSTSSSSSVFHVKSPAQENLINRKNSDEIVDEIVDHGKDYYGYDTSFSVISVAISRLHFLVHSQNFLVDPQNVDVSFSLRESLDQSGSDNDNDNEDEGLTERKRSLIERVDALYRQITYCIDSEIEEEREIEEEGEESELSLSLESDERQISEVDNDQRVMLKVSSSYDDSMGECSYLKNIKKRISESVKRMFQEGGESVRIESEEGTHLSILEDGILYLRELLPEVSRRRRRLEFSSSSSFPSHFSSVRSSSQIRDRSSSTTSISSVDSATSFGSLSSTFSLAGRDSSLNLDRFENAIFFTETIFLKFQQLIEFFKEYEERSVLYGETKFTLKADNVMCLLARMDQLGNSEAQEEGIQEEQGSRETQERGNIFVKGNPLRELILKKKFHQLLKNKEGSFRDVVAIRDETQTEKFVEYVNLYLQNKERFSANSFNRFLTPGGFLTIMNRVVRVEATARVDSAARGRGNLNSSRSSLSVSPNRRSGRSRRSSCLVSVDENKLKVLDLFAKNNMLALIETGRCSYYRFDFSELANNYSHASQFVELLKIKAGVVDKIANKEMTIIQAIKIAKTIIATRKRAALISSQEASSFLQEESYGSEVATTIAVTSNTLPSSTTESGISESSTSSRSSIGGSSSFGVTVTVETEETEEGGLRREQISRRRGETSTEDFSNARRTGWSSIPARRSPATGSESRSDRRALRGPSRRNPSKAKTKSSKGFFSWLWKFLESLFCCFCKSG